MERRIDLILEKQFSMGEKSALRQTMLWIAQLGSFLARKGDGRPGVKTLWRGFFKV